MLDKEVEDIVIDKSGGNITFDDGFTADSLDATGTDGAHTIDFNGQAITLAGALEVQGHSDGPTFYSTDDTSTDMQGASITLGGNSTIAGYSGNLLEVDNLDFDLAGNTLTATYCDIEDSTCTNGTGDATSDTNNEGTGNSGWNFGGVSALPYYYRRRKMVA